MVRNQIYTTEDQDKELRLMVAMGEGYYSELVRQGIDLLIQKKKKTKKVRKFDPWRDFIGKGRYGGPTDVSANHDYYLYVEPYENKKKK